MARASTGRRAGSAWPQWGVVMAMLVSFAVLLLAALAAYQRRDVAELVPAQTSTRSVDAPDAVPSNDAAVDELKALAKQFAFVMEPERDAVDLRELPLR